MLPRDSSETGRLETQHQFVLALSNGHLIHPSIPIERLRTVADVGTGTGAWLQDLAMSFRATSDFEFVGFDISPQQFAPGKLPNQHFVVHDMTKPFPEKYLMYFDVVNVRLLSYALKAQDLKQAVNNVVQLIRESYVIEHPADILTISFIRFRRLPSMARSRFYRCMDYTGNGGCSLGSFLRDSRAHCSRFDKVVWDPNRSPLH